MQKEPGKLLYLVSLRSYEFEIISFIKAMNELIEQDTAWFDVVILCEEVLPDHIKNLANFPIRGVVTPIGVNLWGKLSHSLNLISSYTHICMCTADDVWYVPKNSWEELSQPSVSLINNFNFILCQPLPNSRLLAWNGWKQVTTAGTIADPRKRAETLASQGVVSVHAIYKSDYLYALILSIGRLRAELLQVDYKYDNVIEDFVNISNLHVSIGTHCEAWCLRFLNGNYADRPDFLLSREILISVSMDECIRWATLFFSPLKSFYQQEDLSIAELTLRVWENAIGYSEGRTRIWRESIDLLLCLKEDVKPIVTRLDRQYNPVIMTSLGYSLENIIPYISDLRSPEALKLLNLSSEYFDSLAFEEWQ